MTNTPYRDSGKADDPQSTLERLRQCEERYVQLTEQLPALSFIVDLLPSPRTVYISPQVQMRHPGLKCLFMSGHTADTVLRNGISGDGFSYLQKPFAAGGLSRAVKAVLGSESFR